MIDGAVCKGMNFGFYARCGVLGSAWAREQVDTMASLGIDWIALCVTVTQETPQSVLQYRDFEFSPRDDEVIGIIRYIHSKGIKVMLRTMIETQDGLDRGSIWFPHDGERMPGRKSTRRAEWFDGFRKRSVFYARIAEECGCAAYGLESELDRLNDEHGHWKDVIAAVRAVYSGHVNCNHWYSHLDWRDALRNTNHWWHALDSLSCSYYPKVAECGGSTVEEMARHMREGTFDRFASAGYWSEVAALLGKPVFFGETGCTSATGAATKPWNWKFPDSRYDPEEQSRFLQALVAAFREEPWWAGFFWWKWDEYNDRPQYHDDPAGDKGFTIDGKSAASTLKGLSLRGL